MLHTPNDLSPSIYSFIIVFYIVKLPNTFSIIFIATLDFYEDDELAQRLNLELKISKDLYQLTVKNDADDEIDDNDMLHSTS